MDTASAPELRLDTRNNIFVAAALYTASGSSPVRVRNISSAGAMIESAVLPPLGSRVRLSRGSLSVVAEIVRIDGRMAGIRFASRVSVADWLPKGQRGSGQQMADELAHKARLGGASPAAAGCGLRQDTKPCPLGKELLRLQQVLVRAAEDLAGDDAVAVNHVNPLQAIDMVAQALAKLAVAAEQGKPISASAGGTIW